MGILKIRFEKQAVATIREGIKDVEAGRIVSHKKTVRWLRSWGKKRELPPPSVESTSGNFNHKTYL
jgi:predicted transcriptional regulator